MSSAGHPIWPIVRLLVMFLGLTAILWANAKQFDSTEIKSLITYVVYGGIAEGGIQWFAARKRETPCDDTDLE